MAGSGIRADARVAAQGDSNLRIGSGSPPPLIIPTRPERRPPQPLSVDRLAAWLTAVEEHTPGSIDALFRQVARWEPAEVKEVVHHFQTIVKLIRDPKATIVFQEIHDTQGRRRVEVLYGEADLRRLQNLAHGAAERVGIVLDLGAQEDRRDVIADALVLRAAWLHSDLAILAAGERDPSERRATAFSEAILVRWDDGRQTGAHEIAGHLDVARTMLRYGRRVPSMARPVALWYRATAAHMQRELYIDRVHLDQAVQLFPRDADLWFLAGALHEMCALPRAQEVVDTLDLPYGVTLDIGSPRAELRRAERMFRRSLDLNPRLTEARIRLGNVLGLLGRHEDSVKEIEGALAELGGGDTLLTYFARMFPGREAEALDDARKARSSYEEAVRLYPRAQSPLVALSYLAGRDVADAAAREITDHLLQTGGETADDPWWSYSREAGRFADALMAEARETFTKASRP